MNFLLLLLAVACAEYVTSPEYVDYLRSIVDWEVTDYEENIFKGWTIEELKATLNNEDLTVFDDVETVPIEPSPTPSSVSWMGANCIHEISRNIMENFWARNAAAVVSDKCCLEDKDYGLLSHQEFLSCDHNPEHFADKAFEYVKKNGLADMKCMPPQQSNLPCPKRCYDGREWNAGHHCKCQTVVDCSGLDKIKTCLKEGPIAVRIILYQDFYNFKGGVYCHRYGNAVGELRTRCTEYVDGARLALKCVGTWGPSWGEQGYFRIYAEESCGLRLTPQTSFTVKGFK